MADQYFEDPENARFMIVAHTMHPERRSQFPSVVHVDGSIRPQTVHRQSSPFYWECLDRLRQLTGEGIVLNTSLNQRGHPMVESPRDVLGCFFSSGLDALAMGDYWIRK